MKITTLDRPVGPDELELIRLSGWRAFPPRLPEQPIFYPVTYEAYAIQIARDGNVRDSGSGYVSEFAVDREFLARYTLRGPTSRRLDPQGALGASRRTRRVKPPHHHTHQSHPHVHQFINQHNHHARTSPHRHSKRLPTRRRACCAGW